MTAKVQAIVDGGERRFAAWRLGEGDDPGMQLLKSLSIDYTLDGSPRKSVTLDGQIVCLDDAIDAVPIAQVRQADNGDLLLEAWQNGSYEAKTAAGRTLRCQVDDLPAVLPIGGPWDVSFPAQTGAPENVTLDQLISWSDHRRPGYQVLLRNSDLPKHVSCAARSVGRRPRSVPGLRQGRGDRPGATQRRTIWAPCGTHLSASRLLQPCGPARISWKCR